MVKTFGEFEFDDRRRGLKTGGRSVKFSGQAVDLLCLLLERPGELITREEIARRLWPDTTVDYGHSLDVVVSRLRTVLGDKGSSARYIETVPRKGYRFIETVAVTPESVATSAPRQWYRHRGRPLVTYAAIAILVALVVMLFVRTRYDKFVPSHRSQTSPTLRAQ